MKVRAAGPACTGLQEAKARCLGALIPPGEGGGRTVALEKGMFLAVSVIRGMLTTIGDEHRWSSGNMRKGLLVSFGALMFM